MSNRSTEQERNVGHTDRGPKRRLPSAVFLALVTLVFVIAAVLFVGLGAYNVAADAPHTRPVYWLLDRLRYHSVDVRAQGIKPPSDLDSPVRIATGAGLYAEMCSSCHLAPGMEKTELSQGLYPQAPVLADGDKLTPAQQFWIIKHGVKLSAMPAWGRTHPDPLIWDMVAFIRKLPDSSPQQYKALVASAPADHDELMKDMSDKK